jgi:hypothetical protein
LWGQIGGADSQQLRSVLEQQHQCTGVLVNRYNDSLVMEDNELLITDSSSIPQKFQKKGTCFVCCSRTSWFCSNCHQYFCNKLSQQCLQKINHRKYIPNINGQQSCDDIPTFNQKIAVMHDNDEKLLVIENSCFLVGHHSGIKFKFSTSTTSINNSSPLKPCQLFK